MKFKSVDEMEQFSFEDSEIKELTVGNHQICFTFSGAMVKADNSQNKRYQDMYCGEIVLQLENTEILRVVKEGMKYYDADGRLLRDVPDEDVPESNWQEVFRKCAKGKVFTTVADEIKEGYAYEFGIDVPRREDDEEVDTYWLCLQFERGIAMWDRYCSPAEEM